MKERPVPLGVDTHCARLHSALMKDREEEDEEEKKSQVLFVELMEMKETKQK